MRNLSKVTALALMSLSGVAFTAPALAPDYAKIEARKKAK